MTCCDVELQIDHARDSRDRVNVYEHEDIKSLYEFSVCSDECESTEK